MRAELYPFCVPGVEVVALATLFDDGDSHGWSRATYGEHWPAATLTGVVSTVTDASALVRWEDGDEMDVQLEDIELNGETLVRRAQTALVEQSKAQTRSRTEKSLVDGATSGHVEVEPESEEEPIFTYAG
jgi:endonuclease YncB( thermonuclease family)